MSEHSILNNITQAQADNRLLVRERRFVPTYFEGVQVFRPIVVGSRVGDWRERINSRYYTFTADRLHSNNSDSGFRNAPDASEDRNRAAYIRGVGTPSLKKGICLHHTAGFFRNDLRYLTGWRDDDIGRFTSTPFLICPAGFIYQLSDPDKELSWHLGARVLFDLAPSIALPQRTLYHNQVIGIELSSPATVINNFLAQDIITLDEPFRECTQFVRFTDAQYNSLRTLIRAICRRYSEIRFELLPEDCRHSYFGRSDGDGLNDRQFLLNWRGISSHVNWVGRRQNDAGQFAWTKWDLPPAPAFDWDRLINGPDEPRPLEAVDNTPALQWYTNTELRRKGGYFPVGCNGQIHTGVHIFSDATEAPVRSMADGYIAAFRFFNQEQEEEHSQNLNSLGITQARNNGFILIRHDFQRPIYSLFRANRTRLGYTSHTVYSLYMGFGLNIDQGQIPWVQNLLTNYSGMIPAEASCITEESRRLEGCNDVITFSRPLLPVKAGEVIWRTRGTNGNNHIHWEVFTPARGFFSNIMGGKESIQPQRVSPWAYGNADELNRLFSRSNFRFSPLLGIYGDRNTGILRDFKNLVPFIDNRITFKDFLREFFAANDTEYTGRIRLAELGQRGNSETVFRAFDRRRTELRAVMGKGRKIIVIPENRLEFELLARPSPNANNLIRNKYSLQMTLQALQRTHSIQITRRMQGSNVWDDMGAVFEHRSFFRDFASNRQMLRNAHFSARSPWTEEFWNNAVREFQHLGLSAFSNYEFEREHFISQMPFDASAERPVYDYIFSRDTAFFTHESILHYMHPVTFIWLQLLNVENRFLFTVPIADNNQFSGDTMIT